MNGSEGENKKMIIYREEKGDPKKGDGEKMFAFIKRETD